MPRALFCLVVAVAAEDMELTGSCRSSPCSGSRSPDNAAVAAWWWCWSLSTSRFTSCTLPSLTRRCSPAVTDTCWCLPTDSGGRDEMPALLIASSVHIKRTYIRLTHATLIDLTSSIPHSHFTNHIALNFVYSQLVPGQLGSKANRTLALTLSPNPKHNSDLNSNPCKPCSNSKPHTNGNHNHDEF